MKYPNKKRLGWLLAGAFWGTIWGRFIVYDGTNWEIALIIGVLVMNLFANNSHLHWLTKATPEKPAVGHGPTPQQCQLPDDKDCPEHEAGGPCEECVYYV